jgi:uncharacterized protein
VNAEEHSFFARLKQRARSLVTHLQGVLLLHAQNTDFIPTRTNPFDKNKHGVIMSESDFRGRRVLITGASAGIGQAFAEVFAEHGFDLILVARRQDKLQALADELVQRFKIDARVLPTDLSDPQSPQRLYADVQALGLQVDVLVNNAGYALKKSFTEVQWSEHADFIQVMMTSLVHLCHLFSPGMKERQFGRILNVASVAAFTPEFRGSLYGAAKSFVTHFSEAIDLELKPHNVYCMALCPGFTRSEFHDVMGVRKTMEKLPRWLWMDAETVASQGFDALMKGESIYVNGLVNRTLVRGFQWMPRSLRYFMAKKQRVVE